MLPCQAARAQAAHQQALVSAPPSPLLSAQSWLDVSGREGAEGERGSEVGEGKGGSGMWARRRGRVGWIGGRGSWGGIEGEWCVCARACGGVRV
eukprot:3815791-Rhodomonas_salina.2